MRVETLARESQAQEQDEDHLPVGQPRKIGKLSSAFAGVTLVLVIVILFLSYQLYLEKSEDSESERVSALARKFVVNLTTYSHGTIDSDLQTVLADATGNFRNDYERALGGEAFKQSLARVEGRSQGKVIAVTVTALGARKATVTAIVEQTTINNELEQPRVETNRVQMSLLKTGSGWKVDEVTSVSPL